MANSFDTVTTNLIAQEALTRLVQNLGFFKSVQTNFSRGALTKGQSVVTHIMDEMSAADVNISSGYDANVNDATQTAVNITLDQHKATMFQLTDDERDKSDVDLFSRFAPVAAYGLGKGIVDFLLGSSVLGADAGNISNTVTLSGGFSMDDLIDLGAEMDEAGVPEGSRWIVVQPKVLASLEKDVTSVTNATFNIGGTIVDGGVSRIRGFNIYSYGGGVLSSASTECGAVAGFGSSLALVTAPPSSPPSSAGADLSYVSEPETGLTIQRREWYDANKALFNFALTLYFGGKLTAGDRAWAIFNA